jgi:hypothetical protein
MKLHGREFIFDKKRHRYNIENKPVPSLSSVLNFWYGDFGWDTSRKIIIQYLKEQRSRSQVCENLDYFDTEIDRLEGEREAADRGRRVHLACQYYAQGILKPESLKTQSDDLTGYIEGFKKFFDDHFIAGKAEAEVKRYITYLGYMFCGMSLDLVYRRNRVIIEIKTGVEPVKTFYGWSRYDMQINAQIKSMASTKKPVETWTGFLLYLYPGGEYKCYEKKHIPTLGNQFIAALTGWYNRYYKNYKKEVT